MKRKRRTFPPHPLPDAEAIDALRDVHRNGGMMLEPETGHEAALLWKELRRRGWVKEGNITAAGHRALTDGAPDA